MPDFAAIIKELGRGNTYAEISDYLQQLVLAVQETRKAGSLQFTLKIKPNGDHSFFVSDDIKAKIPQPARPETIFFVTAAGELVRNDPRQADLPLRQLAHPLDMPMRHIVEVEPIATGSD